MIYKTYDINLNKQEGVDPLQKPTADFYILDTPEQMTAIRKRPMVLVCAGGAYLYRSKREGEPVIMQFLARGYHCALVHYSVTPAKWPCAARELAHAVAIARENAEEWNVKEDAIFICGFSAGGHLVSTLATIWNDPLFFEEFGLDYDEKYAGLTYDSPEAAKIPWKPDGSILGYPVITMLENTHADSRDNLLSKGADRERREMASMEKRVTKATVPSFIWHTKTDGSVPVANSLDYAKALETHGVPCILKLYETGCHGLSLCNELTATGAEHIVPENAGWINLASDWVKERSGNLFFPCVKQ